MGLVKHHQRGLYNIAQCVENDYHSRQSSEQEAEDGECTADVWHQVFWGYKQRVLGSNGLNAAQLSCPQGSTLAFQHEVGVSCGTGLRHGATMHPRGRHFRGIMTLMQHGVTHLTAREQQPTPSPHNHQLEPLRVMTQCRNWNGKHLNKFPRRDVSQRSSIANSGNEFGEPSFVIGPTVNTLRGLCEIWLSSFRTRSN